MSQTLRVANSFRDANNVDKKSAYSPYMNDPTQTIDTRNAGENSSPFQGSLTNDLTGKNSQKQLLNPMSTVTSFRVHPKRGKTPGMSSIENTRFKRHVNRLSQPKLEYIPRDPYMYSDFRGLLNADFKEALVEIFPQE
jgi:hypothetical protein